MPTRSLPIAQKSFFHIRASPGGACAKVQNLEIALEVTGTLSSEMRRVGVGVGQGEASCKGAAIVQITAIH